MDVPAALAELSQDLADFGIGSTIDNLLRVPPDGDFYRHYVSKNVPCVVRHAAERWPALQRWNLDYFADVLGDARVTATFTPDGRADAVKPIASARGQPGFVLPHTQDMTMRDFVTTYRQSRDGSAAAGYVPSVQFQNNNLVEQFRDLFGDMEMVLPWASQAFRKTVPEAVNLWIGDSRSSTTYHKART